MTLLAIFGISGGALALAVQLLVLFLIVTYLALIYWTYMDAKRRIEDPVLIACATAASFFPYIGTIVYTILRPPEFLEDREERELELRAAELRLRQLIEQSCPHCEYPIESGYVRCPNCERRLRSPCRKCSKPLDPKWGVCPYCETEVRRQQRSSERGDRGGRDARRDARRERSSRPARSAPQAPSGGSDRPERSERAERSDAPRRQQQQQPAQRPPVSAQGRPQQPRPGGQRPGS